MDQVGCGEVVGIEFVQQGPQQVVVVGRYGAGVDIVEKLPERSSDLRVALSNAHKCSRRIASMHDRPSVVPHNSHQRIGKLGDGLTGHDGVEDEPNERLMRLIPCGIGKCATEGITQLRVCKASQWRVQRDVANKPRIALGLLS